MAQGRLEVLWRTLIQDHQNGIHPAPARSADIYKARSTIFTRRAFRDIALLDLHALFDELARGPPDTPTNPFLAQLAASGYPDVLRRATRALRTEPPQPYDRAAAVTALFNRHAATAMLEGSSGEGSGTLAFGSTERPAPDFWVDYEGLWARVLAARDARDYARLSEALELLGKFINYEPTTPADVWHGSGSRRAGPS